MNEVDSGLMIQDTLQGVPVGVSSSLIMLLVCSSLSLFVLGFLLAFVDGVCCDFF